MYLSCFEFPSVDKETDFLWDNGPGNNSFYPFKVLSARGLKRIVFEPKPCNGKKLDSA